MPVAHGWHRRSTPTQRRQNGEGQVRCSGAGWSQVGEPGLSLFQYGVIRRARTAAESSGYNGQSGNNGVKLTRCRSVTNWLWIKNPSEGFGRASVSDSLSLQPGPNDVRGLWSIDHRFCAGRPSSENLVLCAHRWHQVQRNASSLRQKRHRCRQ